MLHSYVHREIHKVNRWMYHPAPPVSLRERLETIANGIICGLSIACAIASAVMIYQVI